MVVRPSILMIAGALASLSLGMAGAAHSDDIFVEELADKARAAIAAQGGSGITAEFADRFGFPTRHPLLSGGEPYDEATRDAVAKAVASIPGVGGVRWADGSMLAQASEQPLSPLHCQDDVEALLAARTIRFDEASSTLDPANGTLIDEVAAALRPCLGSIISITGHTDSVGDKEVNLVLSQARARAVERALIARGIPSEGLRVEGLGSSAPLEGLSPADPANRRIEFEVVATVPIEPTPIDTPGPR
ncbi:OmpA family protein [Altererythrobacter sp. GH1-8]|uniref:OmpA family protein n=1 Tax=Altererythrobacter sp. GH1-8 TaxID=3349333 RepID=UPI00374DCF9E